jgi:hypothetical protein
MRTKKTSSGETLNKYMKGYLFWEANAFWRGNQRFSKKSIAYFEQWLSDMRANEKHLVRLESSVGNGVRV